MTGFYGRDFDDQGNPMPEAGLLWLDQVRPEKVDWLWPGRLPMGKLVVVDGDPGVGKSTLVLDWIARITTGTSWPDGATCRKGNALIMSAEDGAADTIRPRLDAAGGDPARIALWTEVPFQAEDGKVRTRPPVLPGDTGLLSERIEQTGAVIVMIDVLMAYLSGQVDAHKDQDIRGALHRLAKVAERCNACIVILRHLNKSGGSNAIYRGGGSIGIIGQARAGYIAIKDPDDSTGTARFLACSKINIAREPSSLMYRLVSSEEHGCARIQWGTEIARTAIELLGGADDDEAPNALDDAIGWLQGYLMNNGGEASSRDAKAAARKERISERTLQRALTAAGVTVRSEGFPRRTLWSLDPNSVPGAQSRRPARDSATGGVVVPFPHVKPSNDSEATSIDATAAGTTEEWPEGTIGSTRNEHEE